MTNHGDDCYFFYYSTCAKGDSCPFRHCEAAMGNEVVCNLWQEGHCFRTVCKFRHMEIKKNRREIACYWENQPAGCQKPHCAFHHEKPRFVDGRYIPADKGSAQQEVVEPPEDSAPLPPPPPPLPTAANPQLRGVIKAETQESVPSPTHPPVVINPADDDEDEDDQFSEEEASPRKLAVGSSSDESLNFGIRTLEEIRLRKALKASMKRYAQPMGEDPHPLSGQRTNGVREKENIRSFTGPIIFNASNADIFGEETRRPNIAERLGNRIITKDVPATSGDLHPKRRLAERLGRIVGEEESDMAPPRALKPIRDRLGMPMDPSVAVESSVKPIRERLGMPAEPSSAMESACVRVEPEPRPRSEKAAGEVRIKTLEEIRQAKAAKNPKQKTAAPATKTSPTKTSPKGSKRTVTVVASSLAPAKTFSEFIHSKRKLEEENPQQQPSLKKTKLQPAEAPGESQGPAEAAMPSRTPSSGAEVRVKTLEEIRREKAARTQAQRVEAGNGDSLEKVSGSEEDGAKKSRLLRIKKPASPVASTQKTAELPTNGAKIEEPPTTATEAQPRSVGGSLSTNGSVKVKTFEEIMREKRLRRQQLEDQASSTPPAATTTPPAAASTTPATSSSEAEPAQKQEPAGAPLPRKIPIRARRTPASASSSSSPTPPLEAPPKTARQRISLKPKVASPVASSSQRGSPPRQAEADSPSLSPTSTRTPPGKRRVSPGPAVSKQAKGAASPRPSVEEPVVSQAQPGIQRKSPGQATEAKVRPKLNVKPSVVKPAAQVRPGQKRRAAESAVAAVKPLNSASGGRDEPRSKRSKASPAVTISSHLDNEAQQSATVPPRTPPTQPGPGTSPLRVEPQTAPVTSTVPSLLPTESSVMKAPSQARPRRSSVVTPTTAAASSTVDDFDDLLNEFTGDDRLEDELELDHGKGDDDLLMELSEMIDS